MYQNFLIVVVECAVEILHKEHDLLVCFKDDLHLHFKRIMFAEFIAT